MRVGVFADVHANLHALEATLRFFAGQELDGYVCAGDLVGYGPFPNECVRRVAALGALCVAGNHDLMALGRLSDERCVPVARTTMRWTRTALDDDVRELLAALPPSAERDGVRIHHGTIGDPTVYVLDEARALACLRELRSAEPEASVLVLGHTHHPMAVGERRGMLLRDAEGTVALEDGERLLLNPGAVGQSRTRDARARALVLDLTERVASFHALDYDVAGCRRALRDRGLPEAACHLPRSRWEQALGAAKRRVARARRAPTPR
jgi:predicted phosphodiesterase